MHSSLHSLEQSLRFVLTPPDHAYNNLTNFPLETFRVCGGQNLSGEICLYLDKSMVTCFWFYPHGEVSQADIVQSRISHPNLGSAALYLALTRTTFASNATQFGSINAGDHAREFLKKMLLLDSLNAGGMPLSTAIFNLETYLHAKGLKTTL